MKGGVALGRVEQIRRLEGGKLEKIASAEEETQKEIKED
jgi:hypothetical protein